ncbi:MAG: acetyl-CoA carboxylase biotin carboxylase subunit [Acidobacteriota bacterium]
MFRKLLIANRGEIAVRIIRTARDMGIRTVAIYSECDRAALHVRLADEAYCVGESPSSQSYLRMDRIVDVARQSGAEAVHPGYGFLSENPGFSRACREAGVVFIGPGPDAMQHMGEKIAARNTASECGVPVVPGPLTPLNSLEEVEAASQLTGFPLMLKAAAGGGGKGLRLVHTRSQLASAFRDARSEAEASFGDSRVYLEQYLSSPRHVEFQILADRHGNVIHLGDRECSIQRRHQKVIEECPSPMMTPDLRERMGRAAVDLARACRYENAGTIEFLVDQDGEFYFLEMNTRLQVEHPVTEMTTGLDLVQEQIRIASGAPLTLRQEDVRWDGAAVECRIYAEDPDNQFFPSPGTITQLRVPGGPGLREDSGVYEGWVVPVFYDPLLAKLVTWGWDRGQAIARMRRALDEYQVSGIKTTLPFFRRVLAHPRFIEGRLSTDFIDTTSLDSSAGKADDLADIAVIACALTATHHLDSPASPPSLESNWKRRGRELGLRSR